MFTVKVIPIGTYSYSEPDEYRNELFYLFFFFFFRLVKKVEAALGQDQKVRSLSVDLKRLTARLLLKVTSKETANPQPSKSRSVIAALLLVVVHQSQRKLCFSRFARFFSFLVQYPVRC